MTGCLADLQQSDSDRIMAMMEVQGGPSLGQTCVLIVVFTVLLQSLCVAVTYVYFTNELKQVSAVQCTQSSRRLATVWLPASLHVSLPLSADFPASFLCGYTLTAKSHNN